jgi:hypothetical protein
MRFRDKIMRKGNLTNWIAVLCLAAAGMPAAAQQSPSVLNRVRGLLGQSPTPKPAAAPAPAPKPVAPAPAAPASAQTAAPVAAPAAPLANRPLAPTMKPVSAPVTPNAPAASAESHGPFKPGGNPPIKTVAAAPGAKGLPAKPGAANSKLIPTTPNPRAAAEAKAEAPKDVPGDIPKAGALPAIVPVKENISRRDPFSPLLAKEAAGNGTPLNLPPGKPGLMVGSLHIDGIVNGPNGMIAIVSNPQQRVYFLREGDHLYDGQVEHITMDGISFHQTGKDPFGNAVEREVAKRLNPTSPGEQQ